MRNWLIVLLVLFAGGCGSNKVRPDAVMPSIQANYPTAEFSACGKTWHGLGACFLERGETLDSVSFTIQGYYQGTIRVVSSTCEIDDVFRYEGNQSVRYQLAGEIRESCLISFVMSPEYPNDGDSGVVIHSFKGHLWVGMKEKGDDIEGFVSKISEGGQGSIRIPVDSTGPHRVAFRGCGATFDKQLEPTDGFIEIKSIDLFSEFRINRCVLQGGIQDASGKTKFITWLLWGYDKRFVPLPKPTTTWDGTNLIIGGDGNVSVIAVDSRYSVSNNTKFKNVDKTKPHIIRLITVNARSVLGFWIPAQGAFSWIQ